MAIWPEPVNSVEQFDRASYYINVEFLRQLQSIRRLDISEIEARTAVKNPDMFSVQRWYQFVDGIVQNNLNYLRSQLNLGKCDLKDHATWWQQLPEQYTSWQQAHAKFVQQYLNEQLRLAALFTRVDNETLPLSKSEFFGWELPDRHFVLTFDDGPAADGVTEALIAQLNQYNLQGVFFPLGENADCYENKLPSLYQNHCLASHGYEHFAHSAESQWQDSVIKTHALLNQQEAFVPWFRPPYGQRSIEMVNYLKNELSTRTMLWNIDSQDWQRSIDEAGVEDRVMTLMLLWRRGIVLMHDAQQKTASTLARVARWQADGVISLPDCKTLNEHF